MIIFRTSDEIKATNNCKLFAFCNLVMEFVLDSAKNKNGTNLFPDNGSSTEVSTLYYAMAAEQERAEVIYFCLMFDVTCFVTILSYNILLFLATSHRITPNTRTFKNTPRFK